MPHFTGPIATPPAARRRPDLWLAAMIAIGVGLRLALLFQPIRYDEANTYLVYAENGFRFSATQYTFPNNHILHTLLVHLCTLWTTSVWAIRLPAFVAGVLILPLVACVGRRLGGRHAALFAVALAACSGHLIEYATNGRGYSMLGLFALVQILAADRMARTARHRDFIIFTLATALGFYTVPTMLFPTAATLAWAGLTAVVRGKRTPWRRLAWRVPAYAAACAGLTTLLYTPVLLQPGGWDDLAHNRWVEPLNSPARWWRTFRFFAAELWDEWSLGLTGPGLVAVCGLAVTGIAAAVVKRRDGRLAWLVVAAAVAYGLMSVQRVVPFVRVFGFALPMLFVAAGAGLATLADCLPALRRHAPKLAVALCVGLAVYVVTARVPDRSSAFDKFADADAALAFVVPRLETDTVVFGIVPLAPAWYARHREGLPPITYRAGAKRLWVVTASDQTPEAVLAGNRLSAADFTPPTLTFEQGLARVYELVPLNHRTPRPARRPAAADAP